MSERVSIFEVIQAQRRTGNKYRAIKTTFNGHQYDSKHEAAIAEQLYLLMHEKDPADRILSITPHPETYQLIVNGIKISSYTPDFRVEYESGRVDIIDAKSSITKKKNDYVMRKKLMKALYDIDIIEM